MASAANSPTKRKGRSPRYPGIALDLAVERAKQLWDKESIYPTNVQTALAHWGYAPKSGGGAVAIAALKSFGLLEDSGSGDARTVVLTERAQQILLSDDPVQKRAAIQDAALAPAIHRDLWERYAGQLPSDPSLKLYLMRERGFTPTGAEDLISEYKRTISFSGVTDRGVTVTSDDSFNVEDSGEVTAATSHGGIEATSVVSGATRRSREGGQAPVAILDIPIPLLGGGFARLSLPTAMTEGAWEQMLNVLNAFKPSIVTRESDPDDG